MLYAIGDVHGHFNKYYQLCHSLPQDAISVQIGDMGVGFPNSTELKVLDKHFWIRGNHDNPAVCQKHPNYLGEYGLVNAYNLVTDVFYVGGAFSVDAGNRTPGVDWWADEELSQKQAEECLAAYKKIKPKVVISHDCPACIVPPVLMAAQTKKPSIKCYGSAENPRLTRTTLLLQSLFEAHKPLAWYFGHYHVQWWMKHLGTEFRCVDELEVVQICK